ncbi:MAG: hypothetical protein IKD91_07900 [Clostridiales bacterium]|nr:hypothetical protein [Clostridiales bacterium]
MEDEKMITEATAEVNDAVKEEAEVPAPVKEEAKAPVKEEAKEPVKEVEKETVKEAAPVNKIKGGKYADYTEHDLLVELIKYEKRDAKRTGIVAVSMAAIAIVFVVSAILVVPQVLNTLSQIQTTLTEATSLVGKAEDSLEVMNDMIGSVDKVLSDNTEAMEEAITKIGDIDVDGLNDSINDLREVTSALSKAITGRPF